MPSDRVDTETEETRHSKPTPKRGALAVASASHRRSPRWRLGLVSGRPRRG